MKIRNPNANQVASKITLEDFGRAMGQIDLSGVPPERRGNAVMDHLARVMSEEAMDLELRRELRISRELYAIEGAVRRAQRESTND
jgi:hypothetical protein